jgi:DNA-directed RNA polymerase specialized sigma subunit
LAKRASKHYVNNKDFLEAIIKHKQACEAARAKGKQEPVIPNYIGECIFHMANRLARRPNFSGYAFKEDMIMDGVENCLKYIEKFDPEKSNNPFAYFTQVIWFAFLRRIGNEKKFLYTKLKSSQSMLALGETHTGGSEIQLNLSLDTDYIDAFIQDYEDKLQRDKDKSKERKDDTSSD